MSGGHPFQVVTLGALAICRATWITVSQRGKIPVWLRFILTKQCWSLDWIESMLHGRNRLQRPWNDRGGFKHEARDCFGHYPSLLCAGAAFDQHLQIEVFGSQSFQSVAANGAEMAFIHVTQQTVFQIGVTEFACIVIA